MKTISTSRHLVPALFTVLACFVLLLMPSTTYAQQTFTVPGNSGRNWVDTGINVTPGTLVTVEATGQINAGGSVGNVGPEGIALDSPSPAFPSNVRRAYGLIMRVTDSSFVADSEIREDWAYSGSNSRCIRSRGHLWVTVNDDNANDNTGEFNVRITLGECAVGDLSVRQSVIRVVNEDGTIQSGAEVFVNGRRVGVTGPVGTLTLPALRNRDQIIARFLVHENTTYRENHQAGSTRNWNYRVYRTSAAVNNNGSLASFVVTAPVGTQELRLSRTNTLIGLHLVASVEWDASRAEMENFRDNMLAPMSQFLYNATDGQFFLEQLEMVDNAAHWDSTDFRIYADLEVRPHVNLRRGGFLHQGLATWMNMRRSPASTLDYWSSALTAAHEFGHYGFDLGDEYADGDPSVFCTNNASGDDEEFGAGGPRAACMMWAQDSAEKLCTDRGENPHRRGTRQGDVNCWAHVSSKYRDAGSSRPRWTIRTPSGRGAIVGPLPALPTGWQPRISIDNRSRRSLCGPMIVTARDGRGQPVNDAGVWVHTSYGQTIYQGVTGSYQSPSLTRVSFGDGQIPLSGVHVGDRLAFFRIGYQRAEYIVTSADCGAALTSRLDLRGERLAAHASQKSDLQMTLAPEPFALAAGVAPTSQAGQVQVRVRADAPLKSAPQVTVTVTGSTDTQKVAMTLDQATGSYVGQILKLPPVANASLQVTATNANNQSVSRIFNMSLSPLNPQSESEIFSANGQLSLTVPVGAMPDSAYLTIGPSSAPPPDLAPDFVIVSGPFSVAASTDMPMRKEGVIRFQLPNRRGNRASDGVDPNTFEIRRYNPNGGKWEIIDGTFLPSVDVISVQTNQLGDYAVTARSLSPPAKDTDEKPIPAGRPVSNFAVTDAVLKADEAKLVGQCPVSVRFTGYITANGPGTVRYTYTRSDGATAPVFNLDFKKAGTMAVTSTWTLSRNYEGWQAIKILSPNEIESSREMGTFAVQCATADTEQDANQPKQKPGQEQNEKPVQEKPIQEQPIAQTPSSEDQALRVTAVSLKADDARVSGPCPLTVNFTGHITANRPGTVTYTFTRSDGATAPSYTLEFEQAGTQTVSTTWTLGGEKLNEYQGWQTLKILLPNSTESSRADFFIRCGK